MYYVSWLNLLRRVLRLKWLHALMFPLLNTASRPLSTCFRSNYFDFVFRVFDFVFPTELSRSRTRSRIKIWKQKWLEYFPDRSRPLSSLGTWSPFGDRDGIKSFPASGDGDWNGDILISRVAEHSADPRRGCPRCHPWLFCYFSGWKIILLL